MGLKATVTDIAEVDEAYRDLYKENKDVKTGTVSYCLDIEGSAKDVFHPWIKPLKDEAATHRTRVTTLTGELDKLRPLAAMGNIEEIQAKLDRFPELEAAAAGKIDEKKLGELVEGRVKAKLAPLERDLGQWKLKAGELEKVNTELTTKERGRLIRDALMKASAELKVVDGARDDVAMYSGAFEVQEDGAVVTKDGAGFAPGLSAKQWLEDMQSKRGHWFGVTGGGGAPGSRGAGGLAGSNPWAHDTWSLTEQGNVIKTKGREHADKLAKLAGTTVGGRRPEAPKK